MCFRLDRLGLQVHLCIFNPRTWASETLYDIGHDLQIAESLDVCRYKPADILSADEALVPIYCPVL